jgi:hypothetical protein
MTDEPTEAERQAVARQLAALTARYGDRLDDAGRAVLAERLLEYLRYAAAVRRVPLTGADEPATSFAPGRNREEA